LAVRGLADKCKNLSYINFSGCIKVDDSAFSVLSEKKAFPHLRDLDFSACDMLSSEAVMELITEKPKLRTLRIGQCTQVGEAAVKRIARHGLRLENLSLESCIGCTVEATAQVAKMCCRLRTLSFANCPLVDDSTAEVLAKMQTGLTDLDMSGCKMITDKTMCALVKNNTGLTSLKLYGCPRLGRVMEATSQHCAEMKHFTIGLSNKVTDHGVMRLATGCAVLAELRCTNCPQVSDEIKKLVAAQMPWLTFVC